MLWLHLKSLCILIYIYVSCVGVLLIRRIAENLVYVRKPVHY